MPPPPFGRLPQGIFAKKKPIVRDTLGRWGKSHTDLCLRTLYRLGKSAPIPKAQMTQPSAKKRQKLYTEQDRDNIRWFWRNYLKDKAPRLFLILGMILIQGLVYQQFLSMTESGLRVIFDSGQTRELAMVCVVVFFLFAVRGLMSYLVPLVAVRVTNQAVHEMRRDLIGHLMALDLAYF